MNNVCLLVSCIVLHLFSLSGCRCIADSGGAFVQPAIHEAFGLTVIEAMSTGLPTFATKRGGPSEIIKDNISGFQVRMCARSMVMLQSWWQHVA